MTGAVKIGNHEVELTANAATPFYYSQVFHEDFFAKLAKGSEDISQMDFAILPRIAYIMNQQAENVDITKLSEVTFIEWLQKFEATDFINAGDKIISLYNGNKIQHSNPKK